MFLSWFLPIAALILFWFEWTSSVFSHTHEAVQRNCWRNNSSSNRVVVDIGQSYVHVALNHDMEAHCCQCRVEGLCRHVPVNLESRWARIPVLELPNIVLRLLDLNSHGIYILNMCEEWFWISRWWLYSGLECSWFKLRILWIRTE